MLIRDVLSMLLYLRHIYGDIIFSSSSSRQMNHETQMESLNKYYRKLLIGLFHHFQFKMTPFSSWLDRVSPLAAFGAIGVWVGVAHTAVDLGLPGGVAAAVGIAALSSTLSGSYLIYFDINFIRMGEEKWLLRLSIGFYSFCRT